MIRLGPQGHPWPHRPREIGALGVKTKGLLITSALIPSALMLAVWLGIFSFSCAVRDTSRLSLIKEAHELLTSTVPLREDLENLLLKLEELGTRFQRVEDTMREGKSLIRLADENVRGIRERLVRAEEVLTKAAGEGKGDVATYSTLLREAVRARLELLDLQEHYLRVISDFLDVLPYAEDKSQMNYYLENMERLSREMAEKTEAAARATERADCYRAEKGL